MQYAPIQLLLPTQIQWLILSGGSSMSKQSQLQRGLAGLIAILSVAVLLFTACGNSSTSSSSGVLTLDPSPGTPFAESFNPFFSGGNNSLYGTQGLLYEPLFYYNQITSAAPVGVLGSSVTLSDSAQGALVKLRSGVKWSDNQPFTSADVVFTYNLIRQNPGLDGAGIWQNLVSVQAIDNSTVQFTLKEPSSSEWWYILGGTYIVPVHLWATVSNPDKYTNTSPVGTGPYLLKSYSSQIYKFKANSNYWGGTPKVGEVDFPFYASNSAAELALAEGQLDWDGQFLPDVQTGFVNKNTATNHIWFAPTQVTMLYMNLQEAPFNDLQVRKALAIAINRDNLNKIGESGQQAVANPTGLILPNQNSYLLSDYSSLSYKVDTAQAESILQADGYAKDSNGIYAKGGKELSFGLNVVTGWSDWDQDCLLIQTDLKAIGVNVNVNVESFSAYFTALQSGQFDTAISWTNPGPTPYYMLNNLLNSKFSSGTSSAVATGNYERWNDATTDGYLAAYNTSTDPAVQLKAIQGLESVMVNNIPTIPLLYGSEWDEYSTAHFTGWPTQSNPYAMGAPYTAPDIEQVILHLTPVK
jgi:peptide/nickel transport system substrate-binding protein